MNFSINPQTVPTYYFQDYVQQAIIVNWAQIPL